MTQAKSNIQRLELQCLVAHYLRFNSGLQPSLTMLELLDCVPTINLAQADVCVEHYRTQGLLTSVRNESFRGTVFNVARSLSSPFVSLAIKERNQSLFSAYKITRNGIVYVDEMDPADFQSVVSELQIEWSEGDDPPHPIRIPAASRYVSVKDNQSEFDELVNQLSLIKDEFAKDHNLGELGIDNIDARTADIETFETQITLGWVSRTQAVNLRETLEYLASICTNSAIILASVATILGFLAALFGLPI